MIKGEEEISPAFINKAINSGGLLPISLIISREDTHDPRCTIAVRFTGWNYTIKPCVQFAHRPRRSYIPNLRFRKYSYSSICDESACSLARSHRPPTERDWTGSKNLASPREISDPAPRLMRVKGQLEIESRSLSRGRMKKALVSRLRASDGAYEEARVHLVPSQEGEIVGGRERKIVLYTFTL